MAMIPRDNQSVSPGGPPIPQMQINSSAAAFGALTGQALDLAGEGLASLGTDIGRVVIQTNRENIQRQSKDLYNQYATFKRDQMYGDGTPENPGLLGSNGQDALNKFPEVKAAIDAKRQELMESTDNKYIKEAFTNAATVADESDFSRMLSHVYQQRDVANITSSKATIANATSDAALAWNDPKILQRSQDLVTLATLQEAQTRGLDTETAQTLVKEANGKLLENVINSASQFDYKGAKTLFDQHQDEMDGITRAVTQQKLEAKYKQDISDREQQERFHQWETSQYHQANFDQLAAGIAKGTTTQPMIADAMSKSKVDAAQGENLYNFLSQFPKKQDAGSKAAEATFTAGIYNGLVSTSDIMNNTQINDTQRITLLDKMHAVENNGGLFNRNDVKEANKFIESTTGGARGPLGQLDSDSVQRVALALDDFHQAIGRVPAEELSPDKVREIRDSIVSTYHTPGAGPQVILLGLPSSPYITKPLGHTKDAWTKAMIDATKKLNEAVDKGDITQQEYINQSTVFQQYNSEVSRMP